MFLCGDFNIDILKHDSHSGTKHFVDTMYSLNLYPLINKPTRVTRESATLIDNIFANVLNKQTSSGVLINDITDHFPVYTQCEYEVTRSNPQSYRYSRSQNSENINSFVTDLPSETWQNVTNADNVNEAYDTFINVFLTKYDKHCPIIKINTKHVNSKQPVVYKWLEKCLSQKEQFI